MTSKKRYLLRSVNCDNIKEWFLSHRRSLPWRDFPTPYRVWISEVMLQQTQAAVVVPYFLRWMEAFPTVEALASASLEGVLKMWEGLGYYARARHLHEAARFVLARYGGELPSDPEKLAEIKGLGPYTQGAIRSFAFKQKSAAVDGNVLRVLSRYFAIEEPVDRPKTRQKITRLAEELLPDQEPWLVSEALIELGATVCKKRPLCRRCPLIKECLAYRHGKINDFPVRSPRKETTLLRRYVAIILCGEKVMIRKGERGKVMADLYEFPYLDKEGEVKEVFESALNLSLEYDRPLPEERHTFTRYRAQLFPHLMRSAEEDPRFEWKECEQLTELPFSSGHRRILKTLLKR
ncbi:MAG: A/G-specific adenine glycosylase [Chlamydiales bacterium]|nr:A/G-specific adenine glycosylase [Chlamydiales bacterium]